MKPLPTTPWLISLIAVGISDNILKPILFGRGAAVPMMVIFLGVIGGFVLSGFIRLFTGAIIVSIGYKLFVSWLNSNAPVVDQKS
jgi:predicted PurR-regulated permease PerM